MTATYVLGYEHANADKQKAVVDFYTWAYHNGQKMAEDLGYVALPSSVVKLVEARMKEMK